MDSFQLVLLLSERERDMSKIILIRREKYYRGNNMCKKFITEIRKKNNDVNNMPTITKEILKYFGVSKECTEIPIVDMINKIGIKIYQSELEPQGLSGYIAVNPQYAETFGSNKITCVHISDSIGHKRFTLAHELAHYIFDFQEDKDLCYYNTYFPTKQQETLQEERANKFAANLLMPKEIFIEVYHKYEHMQSKVDIVNEISKVFIVSPTAVIKRFDELGINGFSY